MKHKLLLCLTALATLFAASCSNDDDGFYEYVQLNYAENWHTHDVPLATQYKFTIRLQGQGEQVASVKYDNLYGSINPDDVVLAYMKTNANAAGSELYWTLLPYTNKDGDSYYYEAGDHGILYFYAICKDGYTWANDFDKYIKVVVIPASATTSAVKGIDYSDYAKVAEIYGLEDEEEES